MTGAPRPGATLRLLPSMAQQRANVLLLCRADLHVSQKTLNPNQMFKAPYKSDPDTRADSPSLCCVLQTHRNRRGTRALVPRQGRAVTAEPHHSPNRVGPVSAHTASQPTLQGHGSGVKL